MKISKRKNRSAELFCSVNNPEIHLYELRHHRRINFPLETRYGMPLLFQVFHYIFLLRSWRNPRTLRCSTCCKRPCNCCCCPKSTFQMRSSRNISARSRCSSAFSFCINQCFPGDFGCQVVTDRSSNLVIQLIACFSTPVTLSRLEAPPPDRLQGSHHPH